MPTSEPRIGELFAGYGGLGMGVQAVHGGEIAWVSELDKGANKILAHRFPGVPNHGDITRIDWAAVEPVDILTGGFPCQPVSQAGRGLGEHDERWLWDEVARAASFLQPRVVVLENVRGLLTAGAGRLFGQVLGRLADLGYDASWHGLRASEVGAPHGRYRIFIAAHAHRSGLEGRSDLDTLGEEPVGPRRQDAPPVGRATVAPGPATADTDRDGPQSVGGLEPVGRDADRCGGEDTVWGKYEPAIRRWELVLGRAAPRPVELRSGNGPRLDPAFSEWMMGLPAGWVADVPGITRSEALKALGNGVVPQQAAAALRVMADWERVVA